MMEGREECESCAFTRVPYGTDVDFGELTRELVAAFVALGGDVQLMTEVRDLQRDDTDLYEEPWVVTTRKSQGLARNPKYRARFVFVGVLWP